MALIEVIEATERDEIHPDFPEVSISFLAGPDRKDGLERAMRMLTEPYKVSHFLKGYSTSLTYRPQSQEAFDELLGWRHPAILETIYTGKDGKWVVAKFRKRTFGGV
jgi:hypothetical protein